MLTRVPDDMAYVVERLGRYHRTLAAGTHFLTPLFDRVAFRHVLRPRAVETSDVAISLDNVAVSVRSAFQWRIVDPRKASYEVADVAAHVAGLFRTRQREWIGRHAWKDVRETTRQLESDVARAIAEEASRVGVELVDVSVQHVERAGEGGLPVVYV